MSLEGHNALLDVADGMPKRPGCRLLLSRSIVFSFCCALFSVSKFTKPHKYNIDMDTTL